MLRNKFEKAIAADLKKRGIKYTYEEWSYNYILPVRSGGCFKCGEKQKTYSQHWYTPDFFLPNGVIVESKGYFKATDRSKHVAVRDMHPDEDIRFVFKSNNKLHPKSDTRYSDWCDKYGFKYAFTLVPEDWIDAL